MSPSESDVIAMIERVCDHRLSVVCGTLERCDSAKAFEVLTLKRELLAEFALVAGRQAPVPADTGALPKRSPSELAQALLVRADMLTGAEWERTATAAMMREAADLLAALEQELDSTRRIGRACGQLLAEANTEAGRVRNQLQAQLDALTAENADLKKEQG